MNQLRYFKKKEIKYLGTSGNHNFLCYQEATFCQDNSRESTRGYSGGLNIHLGIWFWLIVTGSLGKHGHDAQAKFSEEFKVPQNAKDFSSTFAVKA